MNYFFSVNIFKTIILSFKYFLIFLRIGTLALHNLLKEEIKASLSLQFDRQME